MRLQQKERYGAICLDEAVGLLFTRKAMSSTNIEIVQAMATCRYKNLFFVFCIPELGMIDAYMRVHRPRGLIRILDRGTFAFYSQKKIAQIKRDEGTRMMKWPEANFIDKFPPLNGNLWKDYLKKKEAFISTSRSEKVWKKKLQIEEKMKKSYTLRDIATMHGFKIKTLTYYFYSTNLFPKREVFKDMFGNNRITERGYRTFIKRLEKAKKTLKGMQRWLKPPLKAKKKFRIAPFRSERFRLSHIRGDKLSQ